MMQMQLVCPGYISIPVVTSAWPASSGDTVAIGSQMLLPFTPCFRKLQYVWLAVIRKFQFNKRLKCLLRECERRIIKR